MNPNVGGGPALRTPSPVTENETTLKGLLQLIQSQTKVLEILIKEKDDKARVENSPNPDPNFTEAVRHFHEDDYPAVPLDRRSSFMRMPDAPGVNGTPLARAGMVAGTGETPVSVVLTEKEVEETEKLQFLTVKSVVKFIKIWENYNRANRIKRSFQQYFSPEVMSIIFKNEESSRKTPFGLSGCVGDLYHLPHAAFMNCVAGKLRPEAHQKYWETMRSVLKRIEVPSGFTLASDDYDTEVFQQVEDLYELFQKIDELLRAGATRVEEELLPPYAFGTQNNTTGTGVFDIGIAALGPIAQEFKRYCGVDNLKACKDMKTFIRLVSRCNSVLSEKAKQRRTERLNLAPKATFDELVTAMTANPKDNSKSARQVPDNKRILTRPRVQGRLFAAEDDVSTPLPPSNLVDDSTDLYQVYVESGQPDFDADQLAFIKSYKDKPPERVLPCWEQFNTRKCQAGEHCAFSHDPAVLRAYAEQKLQEIFQSPYVSSQSIMDVYKRKVQAEGSARPQGSLPTQDARRLVPGRGFSPGRGAGNPRDNSVAAMASEEPPAEAEG